MVVGWEPDEEGNTRYLGVLYCQLADNVVHMWMT
jgi:hypothetical protein